MTSDIVERLENWNRGGVPTAVTPDMLMREAADEIKRLRNARNETKERCAKIADQALEVAKRAGTGDWYDRGYITCATSIARHIRELE